MCANWYPVGGVQKSSKDRPGEPQTIDDESCTDPDMPDEVGLAQQLEAVMDDLNLPGASRATIRRMPRAQRVRLLPWRVLPTFFG